MLFHSSEIQTEHIPRYHTICSFPFVIMTALMLSEMTLNHCV